MAAPKRALARSPEVIAVISDLHAGSTVGLCGAQGPRLDDGQVIQPSKLQQWLWNNYLAYWGRVREVVMTHGASLTVVCNGDAVDGPNHHGTTQSMSVGKDAQSYIAHSLFQPIEAAQPERVFLVRGTTSHVGEAGGDEESLAASLAHSNRLPIKRDPTTHLWTHQILLLDPHGVRIDFRHHASVGGLPWTAPGAIARLAFRIWVEHMERGWPAPDLAIRSHLHHYRDSFDAHRTRAIVTPAWQAKSNYAHQKVTETISDFGGLIVVVPPVGRYTVEAVLFEPERIQPWRP